MNEVLERRFAEMGARVSLGERPWRGRPRIDVRTDAQGEVFTIDFNGRGTEIEVEVVDVQPRDRHLLLLVRDGGEKSKFLCGHDERHWFVAAVPETARGVTGVTTAKLALQPEAVARPADRRAPEGPAAAPQRRVRPPGRVVLRPDRAVAGAAGRARAARRAADAAAAARRTCCSSRSAAAATSSG